MVGLAMTWWDGIWSEARDDGTLLVVLALVVLLPALRAYAPESRVRRASLATMALLHLVVVPIAGILRARGHALARDIHLVARITAAIPLVYLAGTLLFLLLLPRIGLRLPRIVQDVVLAASAGLSILWVLSTGGIDVSGLLATSAVLTVLLGFALQDTLGNAISGLALQVDDSIHVGDWIKIGEVTGRVIEITWRYTALETRNWETLVIPNSTLTKQQFLILGRRTAEPLQWRRWVYFNVDFRYQPSDVIEAVEGALRSTHIEDVAQRPQPNCVVMEISDSFCRYAVRYWLTNLAADDLTDSVVRTRIYFALKRVDIPLSIPAHALFVTEESAGRKAQKSAQDDERRLRVIRHLKLFADLNEEEQQYLASKLRYAPFTRGEVMTRQGATAHWLYIILQGQASVRVSSEAGVDREVQRLFDGSFFGEMSLMTGEPRSATVVALSDVECYRLDKEVFQSVIQKNPQLAEHIAELLAARSVEIMAVKRDLGASEASSLRDQKQRDLVGRIRDFFGLQSG
jgi:small-conductance mechanosensitive channel/CRP-like cAMP-binding protein